MPATAPVSAIPAPSVASPGLLLLADSRLPAGGHAHSGGIEAAAGAGAVHDMQSLADFLLGRAWTAGLTAAGLSAAACHLAPAGPQVWALLDAEVDARNPAPAVRQASRAQGRSLLRVARAAWPYPCWPWLGRAPHHPLVLGAAVAAVGGAPGDAAALAVQHAVAGPASAAVRLLSLDPIAVAVLQARLASQMSAVVERATRAAARAVGAGAPAPDGSAGSDGGEAADLDLALLPAPSGVLLDLYAQTHAAAEVHLFAS